MAKSLNSNCSLHIDMVDLKSTIKQTFKYNPTTTMEVVSMYWDPFDELNRMHREMDNVFRGFLMPEKRNLLGHEQGKELSQYRNPVCNIQETETGILATFEIPGASKDDIELNVTEDSIEIKAEKKHEKKEKDSYSYRSSSFYRRIPLPKHVDADKAKASYKNGLLRIEIPKKAEKEDKKKRIEIE